MHAQACQKILRPVGPQDASPARRLSEILSLRTWWYTHVADSLSDAHLILLRTWRTPLLGSASLHLAADSFARLHFASPSEFGSAPFRLVRHAVACAPPAHDDGGPPAPRAMTTFMAG